jgi:hypothetical protein
MDSSNLVNASIIMYISFTFLFFVLKFRFFPQNGYAWILIFLSFSCIFQTIQNMNLTADPSICGRTDINMALKSTLFPWVLVFGVFALLMVTLPGWVRVFSNTFGVFAAEAYGLKEILNRIFEKPVNPGSDPAYLQMLENIYSDRMALVLELNIDDVEDGPKFKFPSFDKLIELKIVQAPSEEKQKDVKDLYYALMLRDNVGYFFWFLLMGIFCILVSTNTLLASNCSPKLPKSYGDIFKS